MTDIEQLLRESLQAAPTPEPRSGDPVRLIERRVRRFRALALGATVAVAAVTAAVVVPVALRSDRGEIVHVPPAGRTPSPSAAPSPAEAQAWSPAGAVTVVAGGNDLWLLRRVPTPSGDRMFVDQVDPATHDTQQEWRVAAPADFMTYGDGFVYVWGGGDGGYPDGQVQAIELANRQVHAATFTLRGQGFSGIAPIGHPASTALVAAGDAVLQLDVDGSRLTMSHQAQVPGATGIVTTEAGATWVSTSRAWYELDVRPGPTGGYVLASATKDKVGWRTRALAAAGGDAIWTYDGRLIALSPSLLHTGESVAQGYRIGTPGPVTAVAGSAGTGLYVEALNGTDFATDSSSLYYLSPTAMQRSAGVDRSTPRVDDVTSRDLAADPDGGVDFVAAGDRASHWQPRG